MIKKTSVFLLLILLGAAPSTAQDSGPRKAFDKQRELIAVVPHSWKPQYDRDKNGNPIGFAIDVMNEIAARAGVTVIYKGAENFTDAVDILDRGEADLIPNSRIRANRLERYAFSIPVETYFISIFIHKNTRDISGLSDLVGKRLGVVKSHIGVRLFRGRNDIHLKVSPNIRSALKNMINGEIDALVYSQPAVINAAREIRANGDIRMVGQPLLKIERAIRVTKNNAGLLEILNPAVKSFVSTPAYQRLYDKWFLKPKPFWTLSRVLWVMGGLMVVVFVCMGWWRYRSVMRLNQMLQIEAEERKAAEEQLRQAQKMEVVGQLTGGVAHDFNNLLAVIQGNIELLLDEIGQDNKNALAALRATRRGAELTQRLLAFSRRQPLHPQPTDISTLIAGMGNLLERTLGASIEVTTTIAPGLWPALVDPGQMENALLNLAVNARDAMPNGGKLTMVCDNACVDEAFAAKTPEVSAGDYVALAVSDTGKGMTPDVLEHAFEPFFTTKRVGQGSGLGLSMVYGFAKQSGGHVFIDSDEGRGTNVKLYLPRAGNVSLRDEQMTANEIPGGGGKVILVLEDDPDVSALVEVMLGSLGYRVFTAPTAVAATEAMGRQTVDLVLSDVVLPGGVNGPQFAAEARTRHPGLKVIFMSGYPAETEKVNASIGPGDVLINKPFKKQALAQALHAALN